MSPLIRTLLAIAFCLSAAQVDAQLTLQALTRDGYAVVPIKRPEPNALIVTATVDGRRIDLILDTGFGEDGVILDSSYAGRLGLTTEGVKPGGMTTSGRSIATRKATASMVTIGNAQIKGVPLHFAIFDALRDHEMRKRLGADGFLGAGFLHTCSAIVDLHNLRLYLRPPGTGKRVDLGPALRAAGLSEAPFTVGGGNFLVDVEINGVSGKMILDTGATLSSVDPRFAELMKTTGYASGIAFTDAAGVVTEAEKAPLRSLKIGGVTVRTPDLLVSKLAYYKASGGKVVGLLGMDTLGQNWSIIDFGSRKLYIAGTR